MALHPAFWPLETPHGARVEPGRVESGRVESGRVESGRPERGRYQRTFGLWRGQTDWVNPRSGNPASTGPAVPAADDRDPVAASWIADGIDIAGRNLAAVHTARLTAAAETAGPAAFLALADLLRALPRLAAEAAAHEPAARTARVLEQLSGRLRAVWAPWTDAAARLAQDADPVRPPGGGSAPADRLRELSTRDVLAFTTCLAYLTPTGLPGAADAVAAATRRMLGDDAWPHGTGASGTAGLGVPVDPAPWPDLHGDLAALLAPLPYGEWRASHAEVRAFADLLAGFLAGLPARATAPAADSSPA